MGRSQVGYRARPLDKAEWKREWEWEWAHVVLTNLDSEVKVGSNYREFLKFLLTQIEAAGLSPQSIYDAFVGEENLSFREARDLKDALAEDLGFFVSQGKPANDSEAAAAAKASE